MRGLQFTSEPIKQGLQGIFDFYRRIKAIPALQSVPVLLWRVPDPKAMYEEAQQLGVSGYIEYVCSLEELVTARDVLLKGGTYYPPIAAR
jgi:DNA-binding NarL/FixJ family response regulator